MEDDIFNDMLPTQEDLDKMVDRLSQDVTFDDDALFEIDEYHEETYDYETLDEVY